MNRTNKTILFLLTLQMLVFSCRPTTGSGEANTPDAPAAVAEEVQPQAASRPPLSWIEPIQLTGVETTIPLRDIAPALSVIDSITSPPGILAEQRPGPGDLTITITGDLGFLSTLRLWSGGEAADMLLKTPVEKKKATLRLRDQGYKEVKVKGEMNAWNPNAGAMKKVNGIWEYTFEAPAGDYPYLFVVDGKEMTDPKNPQKSADGKGGSHSLLSIKKPGGGSPPQLVLGGVVDNVIELNLAKSGAVLAFWECRQLKTRRDGNRFFVDIPQEAASRETSAIRAYGQNEAGVSGELYIPLQNGKPVQ